MTTFDEFQQDRVINVSMTLRQENGETLLAPGVDKSRANPFFPGGIIGLILAVIANPEVRYYIFFAAIIEVLSLTAILLFFMLGPGAGAEHFGLMVGLLVLVIVFSMPSFVGLILYDQALTKKRKRFHRTSEGKLIVKNDNGEDIVLNDDTTATFTVASTIDRNGNDVHDVFMQYGDDTHYIVSGFDRDKMIRLCDDLQEVCKT